MVAVALDVGALRLLEEQLYLLICQYFRQLVLDLNGHHVLGWVRPYVSCGNHISEK
ncbi:hypothetical protein SDC9_170009 [bioreactor metagenome]|uniref:Uncharacterized protein n=1 Tax=bioreactor metagenome TaxID=1076179 RepID=A0A645G934_9ZZZZ